MPVALEVPALQRDFPATLCRAEVVAQDQVECLPGRPSRTPNSRCEAHESIFKIQGSDPIDDSRTKVVTIVPPRHKHGDDDFGIHGRRDLVHDLDVGRQLDRDGYFEPQRSCL